ncbi:MAG: glycosyltransferase family 2 protein [Clostridia bacterium]|nr:glycosyltransferase family 2 protein [Clostridia bacterium]
MKVLIIIPAYNEQDNIERVVDNLIENYPEYDYLVVNDGSKDKTPEICKKRGYNFLDMPINVGLTGGVQAGMMYAHKFGYDYAIQFDGDGQHDPKYIAKMIEAMAECDICIGSRFVSEKKPKSLRMLGSNMIEAIIRLTTGKRIKDPTSGMRMFNRDAIRVMAETIDYGPEPDTIAHLIRSGARVCEVQVEMHERVAGESYLNLKRSVKYMMHMFFSIIFIQWFRKKVKIGGKTK